MAAPTNVTTPQDWERAAANHGLDRQTLRISGTTDYNSASRLTKVEFLHFKVLWTTSDINKLLLKDLVSREICDAASQTDIDDFLRGLREMGTGDPHKLLHGKSGSANGESVFSLVLYYTFLICKEGPADLDRLESTPKILKLRPRQPRSYNLEQQFAAMNLGPTPDKPSPATPMTPATPGSFPRTSYEALVNISLVTLLCALRLRSSHLDVAHWVPDPKPFILRDRRTSSLLEARVDGYLRHAKHREDAFAILEVKPYVRRSRRREIEWQESAQMAAWITQSPGRSSPGVMNSQDGLMRHLLVSQDRHEIYITIAEYDEKYEAYIRDITTSESRPEPPLAPPPDMTAAISNPTRRPGLSSGSPSRRGADYDARPSGSSYYSSSPGTPTPAPPPARRHLTRSTAPAEPKPPAPDKGKGSGLFSGFKSKSGFDKAAPPPAPAVAGPSGLGRPAGAPKASGSSASGFLVMKCYGPFLINNYTHMRLFCYSVVALSLAALRVQ